MTRCAICGGEGRMIQAREMMFGSREQFDYLKCDACGCLGIIEPPADLAAYYPVNYYAHVAADGSASSPRNAVRQWLMKRRNEAQIFQKFGFWGFVAERRPRVDLEPLARMLRPAGLKGLKSRILDVGCGNAELLIQLHEAGFNELVGADPFLPSGWSSGPGLRVLASSIDDVDGPCFDLIMFHHSLEHISGQVEALTAAANRLCLEGTCLVRIPVVTEEVWQEYGSDWVELDAPRHLCIHSPTSFAITARRAGLEIYRTEYDSTGFTYWGSELYRRDLSLHDEELGRFRQPEDFFDATELEVFDAKAVAANSRGTGGRAAFYLRRETSTGLLMT